MKQDQYFEPKIIAKKARMCAEYEFDLNVNVSVLLVHITYVGISRIQSKQPRKRHSIESTKKKNTRQMNLKSHEVSVFVQGFLTGIELLFGPLHHSKSVLHYMPFSVFVGFEKEPYS